MNVSKVILQTNVKKKNNHLLQKIKMAYKWILSSNMISMRKLYFSSQILNRKITICLGEIESKMKFLGKIIMTHKKMIQKKTLKSK